MERFVKVLKELSAGRIRLSDEDQIGVEKIANTGAKRDEFGRITNANIGTHFLPGRAFQRFDEYRIGVPGHDSTGKDNQVWGGSAQKSLADFLCGGFGIFHRERVVFIAGSGDDYKRNSTVLHRFGEIGGGP